MDGVSYAAPESDDQKTISTKFIVVMFCLWLAPISILLTCMCFGQDLPGPNARKKIRVIRTSKEFRDKTENDGARHTTLHPLMDDY